MNHPGGRPASSADRQEVEWGPEAVKRRWEGCPSRFAGDGTTRELLRLVRRYVGGDILDAGAGVGGPMKLFPRAVGLDLAPRQPGSVGGDLCLMPFTSEAFDTVFSIEVLEHLPESRLSQGLGEIRRVLRKGGHAVLVVPDREDLTRRRTVCPHCGTEFHWLGHVWSFDADSLAAMLRSAGLDVVRFWSLELGFRGCHRRLGRLSFLLAPLGLQQPRSLVVVARKPA